MLKAGGDFMRDGKTGIWRLIIPGAVAAVLLLGVIVWRARQRKPVSPPPPHVAIASTTQSFTKPVTTHAATQPAVPRTYVDVVRLRYPNLPATQPLAYPLKLSDAAHLIIKEPVYLGTGRRDLWITRADAPPTDTVLREAMDPAADTQTHLVRERVLYVHWQVDDSGRWTPMLVCRRGDGTGEELVALKRRQRIEFGRKYDWSRAWSWEDKIVVPTDDGVSILQVIPQIKENFHALVEADARTAGQPEALWDGQGVLAWVPADRGKGGRAIARFANGQWKDLDPSSWPPRTLQLIPLRDGSVLQIIRGEGDAVKLEMRPPEDAPPVDEKQIEKLVEQLSDEEVEKRKAAYDELTQYGSGAWPVLQRMLEGQPPEVQVRLRHLLKSKIQPMLGGMSLVAPKIKVVGRLTDGGAVFLAEAGVSIPGSGDTPTIQAPAWLSIRPGRAVELLANGMVGELNPAKARLFVIDSDWIVTGDAAGPRWFVGNGFVPLLRKDEHEFTEIVGRDARGRWLLRRPRGLRSGVATQASATQPATTQFAEITTLPVLGATSPTTEAWTDDATAETLIIDPTLPDPTPRLPVWELPVADTVGWDKDNWPVIKRGGAWALHETGWKALEKDAKVLTRREEIPPTTNAAGATSRGSTTNAAATSAISPSTLPAPTTAEASAPPALLIDPQGMRYFDGLTSLRVVRANGTETAWPLPPIANGTGPATLIRTDDGKLFLFNQPGRVLRIKPTPEGAEPFALEATFTNGIPTAADPTRIWLDPAGRIDIAYGNHLAVLFPSGYIPPVLTRLMLEREP